MRSYKESAAIIQGGGSIRMPDGEVVTTKKRLAEILNPGVGDVEPGEDSDLIRANARIQELEARLAALPSDEGAEPVKPAASSKKTATEPVKPADASSSDGDDKKDEGAK